MAREQGETSVDVSQESTPGRWDSVTLDLLAVGDRVRISHQRDEDNQQEAEVIALHCSMGVAGDGTVGHAVQLRGDGGIRFCAHRDTWNFSKWVPSVAEEQEYRWVDVDPSELRPGDMARGLNIDGRFGCLTPEAEVTQETITARDEYVYLAGSGGWDRARQWQRRVPVLEPEAPLRDVPPADAPEAPPPGWATSLDAAKRHVHAQARRLYLRGDNCYGGSEDFVEGLGLPTIAEDWPAPEVVDETAQIREFLAEVHRIALKVADDHGKSLRQVRIWLEEQGIKAPPPAEIRHTVTFTAPVGVNVAEVIQGLGWQVQHNPFD